MTIEDSSRLRNRENYKSDLKINNLSKTGMKERCTFNKVDGFHVTEDVTVDMMHMLLREFVCT